MANLCGVAQQRVALVAFGVFSLFAGCAAVRVEDSETLLSDAGAGGAVGAGQNGSSARHVEYCCCPKERVVMESIRAMCGYNLPESKGYKIVMGLSLEPKGARTLLKLDAELNIPLKEEMQFDKDKELHRSSDLVCHEDGMPPRFSECMMNPRNVYVGPPAPEEDYPDDTRDTLNKMNFAASRPWYCRGAPKGSKCKLQFDDELADLCYEVACNDLGLGAPCAPLGRDFTAEELKQKAVAMGKYKVAFFAPEHSAFPYYKIERYYPSACLGNAGIEDNYYYNKSPKGKLQKIMMSGWDCPSAHALEKCRGNNLCAETADREKLPKDQCTPTQS